MLQNAISPNGFSLFTGIGERKYLSPDERARFLKTAHQLADPIHASFCAMLHWTGCRPSEARAVTAMHVDTEAGFILISSLKKRGLERGRHFRTVPVPDALLTMLEATHDIAARQADERACYRLWNFSRTTAWRIVNEVMTKADISGVRACAKGLRHAYGVHAALTQVPITHIKSWLGHASLETTQIYLNTAGAEDRQIAERMWV